MFFNINSPSHPKHAVHMFAKNAPARGHNKEKLNETDTPLVCINAQDEIPQVKLTQMQIDANSERKISDTGNLMSVLKLKIGGQVMLTTNIDLDDRLVNGLDGEVMEFKVFSGVLETIYIKLTDENAGVTTMKSNRRAWQCHWVPIEKVEASFPVKKKKSHPCIKQTEFPLVLSWASIVHKVQELSLNKGVISFQLQRQKSFNQGQIYVALSRVKTFEGTHLIGKYSSSAINENSSAKKEYDCLRTESILKPFPLSKVTDTSLTISLLNIRLLEKHIDDLLLQKHLLYSDMLCLTETQLQCSNDAAHLKGKLQPYFTIKFNTNVDKYKSIAIGYTGSSLIGYRTF